MAHHDQERRFYAVHRTVLVTKGQPCHHDWVVTRESVRLVAQYALPVRVERCAACRVRRLVHWELTGVDDAGEPKPEEVTEWL